MYIRERNKAFVGPEGSRTYRYVDNDTGEILQTTTEHSALDVNTQNFEDVVGNFPNVNPAIQSKVSKSGGIVTGGFTRNLGWYRSEMIFNNWPANRFPIMSLDHLPIADVPSDNWVASEVQGMTNPSEPSVSIPVAIGELKDLPKMLERKSKKLKGNSALEAQFGWGPMVDDLIKLFQLQDSIEQRLKSLRLLGRGKPISRRRTVFSRTVFDLDTTRTITDYHPYSGVWAHKAKTSTRLTKQATVRWAPSFAIGELDPHELRKLAARQVLGLDPQHLGASIYGLIPWTWFIDYFSNLGDLVSTSQNSVASVAGLVAVSTVTETRLHVSDFEYSDDGIVCSPFRMTRRDWVRNPVWPVLEFRMPILTSGQTLTIANLINQWK